MTDHIRLYCPECGRPLSERKEELRSCVSEWVYSDALKEVLKGFDIEVPKEEPLSEYIEDLWRAVQIWDYRKGSERWNVSNDAKVEENLLLIDKAAADLGMFGITDTVIEDPDYILPLGGARMTNIDTPKKAESLILDHGWSGVNVVGLSSERPASDRDRPFFDKYAKGAETEFDAMCGGLEKVFGVSGYTVSRHDDDNINLCSEKRVFDERYRGGVIALLAAPSTDPERRRANTEDTFRFFLEEFRVEEGSKIIFTTNSMYVPFQLMKLMKTALEKDLMIDCVGVRKNSAIAPGNQGRYLQEIKAAIDAIHDLEL